jgi:hypothetical protein
MFQEAPIFNSSLLKFPQRYYILHLANGKKSEHSSIKSEIKVPAQIPLLRMITDNQRTRLNELSKENIAF